MTGLVLADSVRISLRVVTSSNVAEPAASHGCVAVGGVFGDANVLPPENHAQRVKLCHGERGLRHSPSVASAGEEGERYAHHRPARRHELGVHG